MWRCCRCCCSLIIFLWTPPHFWALALYRSGDYAGSACRCCRWSPGAAARCDHILAYTARAACRDACCRWRWAGRPLYGVVALVLGGMFLAYALRLWREDRDLLAMRTFRYSILYLFAAVRRPGASTARVQDLLLG